MKSLSKTDSGKIGEDLAAHFLCKKGFGILERNYHSRYGEIDIIASKADLIVFVEVKYRKNCFHSTPSMAVSLESRIS